MWSNADEMTPGVTNIMRSASRWLASAVFGMAMLLLTGCASVRSDISAINKLPPDLAGKTFHVARYKEQEGSLEFEHYAALVSQELQAKGLASAPAGSADLMVFMRYAFEQHTELVPTPAWGPSGSYIGGGTTVMVGGRPVFVPVYTMPPTFGFNGTTVMPAVVNRRSLNLDIVARDSTPEKPHKLYEASVLSEGYSGTLLQAMPVMIRALFTQWPGPPVRSESVDLPLRAKKQ